MALHKLEETICVRLLIKIYSVLENKVYWYPRNVLFNASEYSVFLTYK